MTYFSYGQILTYLFSGQTNNIYFVIVGISSRKQIKQQQLLKWTKVGNYKHKRHNIEQKEIQIINVSVGFYGLFPFLPCPFLYRPSTSALSGCVRPLCVIHRPHCCLSVVLKHSVSQNMVSITCNNKLCKKETERHCVCVYVCVWELLNKSKHQLLLDQIPFNEVTLISYHTTIKPRWQWKSEHITCTKAKITRLFYLSKVYSSLNLGPKPLLWNEAEWCCLWCWSSRAV